MKKDFTRRAFIKATSVAGIGLAAAHPSLSAIHSNPKKPGLHLLVLGFVGRTICTI